MFCPIFARASFCACPGSVCYTRKQRWNKNSQHHSSSSLHLVLGKRTFLLRIYETHHTDTHAITSLIPSCPNKQILYYDMHLRDEYHKSDVVTAFLLVLTAGAATGIGAGVVFFPNLVRLANRQSLAASLGLASGVMLYVSLVEIFDKAVSGFKDAGHEDGKAFQYATFGFFVGIFIMKVRT